MRDYPHLEPKPMPSDDRIEHGVYVLSRLTEVEGLRGWVVTMRRDNLELTGVWPADFGGPDLSEIEVELPPYMLDSVDPEGSWHRNLARCRLTIRHAVEAADLERDLMREALAESA